MGRQTYKTTYKTMFPAAGGIGAVALCICLFGGDTAGAGQGVAPGGSGESELHWAARFNAVEAIGGVDRERGRRQRAGPWRAYPATLGGGGRRGGGSQGFAGRWRGSCGG